MRRSSRLVTLLGAVGLLVAGCGEGSGSPSVAHLGSTATSASSGRGSGVLTAQQEVAIDVAYAACMTAHGIEVDASRTVGLIWTTGPGVPGRGSPQYAAAQLACRSLVPKGGLPVPTEAQSAAAITQLLHYAECIRAHGVPNYPDPTSQGIRISPSSGIDPNSPIFIAAQKSCQNQNLMLAPGHR
jgi:hypothetical protein